MKMWSENIRQHKSLKLTYSKC